MDKKNSKENLQRDSGVSFNSSKNSLSTRPSASSLITQPSQLAPNKFHIKHHSAQYKGYSANETPPLPPLRITDTKPVHLTYGQMVAVLWPVYGQYSYTEARHRYVAQFKKDRGRLESVFEEESALRVKKKRSLWSLLGSDK